MMAFDETLSEVSPTSVLVLGTADWNQPIATNQHYMTRELAAAQGTRVTFVESMGLRRPQFHRRDIRRILGRLRKVLRRSTASVSGAGRTIPDGVRIISPMVVPLHVAVTESVNRRQLRRAVADWRAHPGRKVLWTYTPVTYGLESDADLVVYHCVDLLGKVEGIDEDLIRTHERRLSGIEPIVIASSAVVAEHLGDVGFRDVRLWENVADTAAIATHRDAHPAPVKRAGRVIFAGNLSPSKVDFDILMRLADAGLEVLVAGPRAEGGGDVTDAVHQLSERGVTDLGALSFDELAATLVTCEVGLIPYQINDYTRGVSPLKTFEYAAAGLRVVSTDLPGVSPVPGLVFRESSPDAFVDRVVALSAGATAGDDVALRELADRHSWIGRGAAARALIDARTDSTHE